MARRPHNGRESVGDAGGRGALLSAVRCPPAGAGQFGPEAERKRTCWERHHWTHREPAQPTGGDGAARGGSLFGNDHRAFEASKLRATVVCSRGKGAEVEHCSPSPKGAITAVFQPFCTAPVAVPSLLRTSLISGCDYRHQIYWQ